MKRQIARILILGLAAAMVVGAGALLWQLRGERQTFYTDADTIRQPQEQARVRDVLWKPAVRLPAVINSAADEYEPRVTPDGLSLLFVRGRAGGDADLYASDRTALGWTEPRPLTELNTAADELGPEPSADGTAIYFYSDRAGGLGGYDLWISRREGDAWSPPVNLGPEVNSRYHDYGPATTPDGAGLYFASNRPRPDDADAASTETPVAVRQDMEHRDYDLYHARIGVDSLEPAEPVATLNTTQNEVAPAVSPGGDFLYFASDRPGGTGGFDILRSRRLRGEHLEAANLGPSLNTEADELDPAVAMGGFGLYFASNRVLGDDEAPEAAGLDLYFAASREVFVETEVSRAEIDWWAVWSAIWPVLLWLLLIALLWLALSRIGERGKLGRLSLLAKCLLLSLLVHALLMLLLTVVEVTSSLSELVRDRSGTRVALVSPSASAAGDLAAQIRGSLTDIEVQVSQNASAQRQEQAVEPEPSSAMAKLTVQRSTIEARLEPPQPAAADDAPAPATTPAVESPTTERQAAPVEVALPAQPRPERATEAAAAAPVRTAQATPARAVSQQAAQQSAASSATAIEVAVQPADLSSDARFNQRLHDAGRMPDAETPPRTAMAEAAPAQPVRSAVPTLDLSLPSSNEAPTERVAEAEVSVAAQAAESVRQRSSSAPRAVTSTAVNVSPQPLDRPLAQGSMAAARVEPASAAPVEAPSTHDRGLTALLVQPGSAPAMPALPETAAAPASEAATDAGTLAAANAPRRAPRAEGGSAAPTPVALETASAVAPSELRGESLSSARASDSPAPDGRPEPASSAAQVGRPTTSLALDLPPSDAAPSTARAASESAQGTSELASAQRSARVETRAAVTGGSAAAATANPRVDLGPVDRSASASPLRSLAAELPTAADAVVDRTSSAGPRQPVVPVDTLAGALDLALPSGPPQIDEPRPELPRGLANATVDARRAQPAAAALSSPGGTQRVDVAPQSAAPPTPDRLVAAARTVSTDGATRRGGEGFEAGGVELTLASSLVAELPELEESVASGPGERGRALPPATIEPARAASARSDLQLGGPARPETSPARTMPPQLVETPPQRLLATAAKRPDLELDEVLGRPEAPPPPPLMRPVLASLDLSLPRQLKPTPTPFEHRMPERRQELVERGGGSVETERAVASALEWLARHQSQDGRWDGRSFDDGCDACEGKARVDCDIAVTGLSLLCFLAADHSPAMAGPYQTTVTRAVEYLLGRMGPSGDMLGDESMYSHGIATIALAEAYGMTGDPRLAQPVRLAVNFIYEARNRRLGGWRYDPGQVGDTSVLGWQVMAIKSAERAGLAVPTAAYEVAEHWLTRVKDPWKPGLYAYQPKRRVTHPMTAEAMFVRQLLGTPPSDPTMTAAADYLLEFPPDWKDANTYYWYYATLALYQHGGEHWERWNERIKQELLGSQRTNGEIAGSWDPDGKWANVAGRVYQTAICTLTLEVYYRYLPLYVAERE